MLAPTPRILALSPPAAVRAPQISVAKRIVGAELSLSFPLQRVPLLGSALGSKDVGGVGGLLLDLGAFFAGELPPEGQVGGFFAPPTPLIRFSRCSGRVKRHIRSSARPIFTGLKASF